MKYLKTGDKMKQSRKMLFMSLSLLLVSTQFSLLAENLNLAQYTQSTLPRISAGAQFFQARHAGKINLKSLSGEPALYKPSQTVAAPQVDGPVTESITYARDDTLNGWGQTPPDNAACVGPNHFVLAVNTAIEWYDKSTRSRQYSESLNTFFAPTEPTDLFDPRVLWDQYNNRYVVIADEQSSSDTTSYIHIAVSQTDNPNDGWYFQRINTKLTIGDTDTWLDFPSLGVSSEALYLTGNMFSFSNSYQATRLWIIDKGLYSGGTSGYALYDISTEAGLGSQAFTIQPAHMYGTQPDNVGAFMFSSEWDDNNGNNDLIAVFRVDDPLGNTGGPLFSVQFLNPGEIHNNSSGVPSAPQNGSDVDIDFGDDRAQSCVWRDGTLVGAFTINPSSGTQSGQATNFWFTAETNNVSSIQLAQQGLIEGDDIADETSTGFPAVSINDNGDIAIGFAASAATIYAGAYFTVHQAGDGAGTNQGSFVLHEGIDSYVRTGLPIHVGNRWGDYSSIALDPQDENAFWVFNQYAWTHGSYDPFAKEDGRWATAFAKILPNGPSAIYAFSGIHPVRHVLKQNYPNPFNPTTAIDYQLLTAGRVRLTVYNALGQKIQTLVNTNRPPGRYRATFDGDGLPSGIYFYVLSVSNGEQLVRKMMLLK